MTKICGSDQRIYRGRFPAPKGMVMGHEMTGEVVELGRDVEFIKKGDLCSVPFNVSVRSLSQLHGAAHRSLHERQRHRRRLAAPTASTSAAGRAGRLITLWFRTPTGTC